jgi:deazaflavin-dependent oxidoreductase (nitroreductase family)
MGTRRRHDERMKRPQAARAVAGAAQRVGSTRAGVRVIGALVSPLQRWLYRRTAGRLTLTGRAPILLLTTTGRRTRRDRTVPLLYLRDGDNLVICNVNPGFERPNPWTLNLRAHPQARVQIRGDIAPVLAREATAAELDKYWPRLIELWPAYESFHRRGGHRSVFILEPAQGALAPRPGEFYLDTAVEIARPADTVYSFLADIQDAEPIPRRARVRMVKDPPGRTTVGTRWHESVRLAPGGWLNVESVVTEAKQPHELGMDFSSRWWSGHLTYTIDDTDHGCVLRHREIVRPRALLSPFTCTIKRRLRLKIEQRLDDIKETLASPLSDHLNTPPQQ